MPERFFFYAVQNTTASIAGEPLAHRPDQLSELPPDPLFPYALLPTPAGGVLGSVLGAGGVTLPVLDTTLPSVTTMVTGSSSSSGGGSGGAGPVGSAGGEVHNVRNCDGLCVTRSYWPIVYHLCLFVAGGSTSGENRDHLCYWWRW